MKAIVNIWHEDSQESSTSSFWRFIFDTLASTPSVFKVRGFSSNKNLAKEIMKYDFSDLNQKYIILLDNPYDNRVIGELFDSIELKLKSYRNVYMADIVCFEYMMLSFEEFEQWVKRDVVSTRMRDLFLVRQQLLDCIANGKQWKEYNDICRFADIKFGKDNKKTKSVENLSAALLSELTSDRKYKFGISKTTFGDCWTCDCCKLNLKCALNGFDINATDLLTSYDKAIALYSKSPVIEVIKGANKKIK